MKHAPATGTPPLAPVAGWVQAGLRIFQYRPLAASHTRCASAGAAQHRKKAGARVQAGDITLPLLQALPPAGRGGPPLTAWQSMATAQPQPSSGAHLLRTAGLSLSSSRRCLPDWRGRGAPPPHRPAQAAGSTRFGLQA